MHLCNCPQKASFDTARYELQALLKSPYLNGVALLVVSCESCDSKPALSQSQLGNKNDLDDHADVDELIQALQVLLSV